MGVARHIVATKQELCSSCQKIYLDTGEEGEVKLFVNEFLPYLEEALEEQGKIQIGMLARNTIKMYEQALCSVFEERLVHKGRGISLIASSKKEMESTISLGACQVKGVPRKDLAYFLYPYRGILQTAGVLCGESEYEEIKEVLFLAGITRVTSAKHMSSMLNGEAHDGIDSLRRYVRVCTWEQ